MGIEAIAALLGLVLPPVVDFAKKKFIKAEKTTPEAVMGNLAVQSPGDLPNYVTALSTYLDAQTRFFNRDVSGQPSMWVINLRASIRPVSVIGGLVMLACEGLGWMELDPATRGAIHLNNSSWFGHKLLGGD